MKATLEIPDDLYRKVKAKSSREGRRLREVTVDLLRQYVGQEGGDQRPGGVATPEVGAILIDGNQRKSSLIAPTDRTISIGTNTKIVSSTIPAVRTIASRFIRAFTLPNSKACASPRGTVGRGQDSCSGTPL